MISRRDVLVGAAAGIAAVARHSVSAAAAGQSSTQVNFTVPADACDCHAHIFGDTQRFPFITQRAYTPGPASVDSLQDMHRRLRTGRQVLVQPSVYGTDHRCLLDALGRLGSAARGVAVIDDSLADATLDALGHAGVCGVRLNLETGGVPDLQAIRQRFTAAVDRIKGRSWHVQLFTRLTVIEAIQDLIKQSPVPVVIDHFGRAQGAAGTSQDGFDTLVNLVRAGQVYVKISAPYLCSTQAPDYPDMTPLARALIAASPQRILWGSDWPHVNTLPAPGRAVTDIWPFYVVDDGRVFNQLAIWAPEPSVRKAILVDTPARLYGFAS
jgi:predicted TIM-barrel fold metal-dependent hydrolase